MVERKTKPSAASWATVLVVVVGALGYLRSFGPACVVLTEHLSSRPQLLTIYEPCFCALEAGPRPVQWLLRKWATCCRAENALDDLLQKRIAEQEKAEREKDLAELRRLIRETSPVSA